MQNANQRYIDHLVYAAPDLDAAIDHVEAVLGVRAGMGGSHPGLGTRNALISLGPRCYLEIIAPDPDQQTVHAPRPFGIDEIDAPRLVTWAARGVMLDTLVADAAQRGIVIGESLAFSRQTPAGDTLSWELTLPLMGDDGGVIPFFIDWGSTPHPAATAAAGASLIELFLEHPDPGSAQRVLRHLGVEIEIRRSQQAGISALIEGVNSRFILR